MPQNSRMLIGAVVAALLAVAVYYGLINQQTANNIQGQTNQTIGAPPAAQQPASPASPNPPPQQAPTAPTGPARPN